MPGQFIAIDVETANRERGSICQIGLVAFDRDAVLWEWSSLVNPECDFDGMNVKIHGIGSQQVRAAPCWSAVLESISESVVGRVLVSHTPFDCEAFNQATKRCRLASPDCRWLDSCAVARMAWPNLEAHDLETLSAHFGIAFEHHEALNDARTCGQLLARAMSETGLGVADWIARAGHVKPETHHHNWRRARARYSERIEADGNPNGPLAGNEWVCTGEFSVGEAKLVELAATLGCDVKERVSKRTTILVLGHRDPEQFGGKEKSAKQLAAEAALAKGRKIAIMTEREFLDLARRYTSESAARAGTG
jgi:DNA polymerase-3 subunit epsilon